MLADQGMDSEDFDSNAVAVAATIALDLERQLVVDTRGRGSVPDSGADSKAAD